MAELSQGGGYVKLIVNVWYDKKNKNVHITSNDKDLPKDHMHMTAKKGTQSDANLKAMLDNFGCGPAAAELPPDSELVTKIKSGELDDDLAEIHGAIIYRTNSIS